MLGHSWGLGLHLPLNFSACLLGRNFSIIFCILFKIIPLAVSDLQSLYQRYFVHIWFSPMYMEIICSFFPSHIMLTFLCITISLLTLQSLLLFCCFLAVIFFIDTFRNSQFADKICSDFHLEKSSLMKAG